MSIFSRNFNKPGPGVRKDEPRKKGAARFFELLLRDLWDLMKLNLLFSLTALPSVAAFLLGFMGFMPNVMLVAAIVLSFPIGGGLTACIYFITKLMRDDPSYVWFEYKRKFLENFKQAAPTGMICTAFIYAHIMIWSSLWVSLLAEYPIVDITWYIAAIFSIFVFFIITPYVFMHFSYIDLKSFQTLKNSILMAFGYFPRSFMGAVFGSVIWVLFALFIPLSIVALPAIPLIAFTLSMLLSLMWVWPPFNKHFAIEETLVKRVDEEFGEGV